MNKRELVRLVAEKLGAANNEVKVAFDIFLQRVAEFADEDSAIRIPEIGIFHLKRKDPNHQGQYILLFLPLKYNPQEKNKILSFDVSVAKEQELTAGESAFNISIGKPLIPITGVNRRDFIVQSSYIMLQKNFEEKTNNLLGKSVQLTNLKIDPRLIETDDESVESFLDDYGSYEMIPEEASDIPWDFGIPSDESTDEKEFEQNENLPASDKPDNIDDDIDIEIPPDVLPDFKNANTFEDSEIISEDEQQNRTTEKSDVIPEETTDPEQFFYKINANDFPEPNNLNPETEFQEHDFLNEVNTEMETNESSGYKQPEGFRIDEEDILSEAESYNSLQPDQNYEEEVEEPLIKEEHDDHYSRMDISVPFQPGRDYVRDDELPNLKVKFGLWFWVLLSVFIIVTAAGIFYFVFNNDDSNNQMAEKVTPEKNIIERDYQIPVTIIPKSDTSETGGNSGEQKMTENTESQNPPSEQKPIVEEQKPPVTTINPEQDNKNILVKEYIFSDGNKFTIQVSSWRTRSVAESEVLRLKNGGLPSYISGFKSKAGQDWYRVRVGDFSSLSEAEDFLSKNVKNLF